MKQMKLDLSGDFLQPSPSGKTSPASSTQKTMPSGVSWHDLLKENLVLHTPPPYGNRWPKAGVIVGTHRKVAWRTLNAQYFGVPQRRSRVYVIASARDDFDPSQVLFEPAGLSEYPDPFREERVRDAGETIQRSDEGDQKPLQVINVNQTSKYYKESDVVQTLLARMGSGGGNLPKAYGQTYMLAENTIGRAPQNGGHGSGFKTDIGYCLNTTGVHAVLGQLEEYLRVLTPVECERLQGFPDKWTQIPYRGKPAEDCPTSNRYKALGNSWAVPVVRWIGKRLHKALCG